MCVQHSCIVISCGILCLSLDERLLSPEVAVEAELKVVVASSRLAEDQTSIAAMSVASFARRVVVANQAHLYLATTGYLYKVTA